MLNLVFRSLTADRRYISKFFEKVLVAGVREVKLDKKNIGISVNLVGEDQIKRLNNKYRKKNKVTDVLSFPMSGRSQKKLPVTSYQLPVTDLGDIFICLPFAKKEAKSENISIDEKTAQLVIHGFLHLAGYDHERSKKEAEKMFNLEARILQQLKF